MLKLKIVNTSFNFIKHFPNTNVRKINYKFIIEERRKYFYLRKYFR